MPYEPACLLHALRPLVLVDADMGRLSLYTHIAVAVLAGVLVWFFQAARLGADLADERLQASQYREQITTERAAANASVAQAGQQVAIAYQGALNDAIKTQATLQAAATRAGRERDSLREQLSTAQQRIATASASAVAEYSATASELLAQCGEEVTDLAAKADGHANDAATCRAAWPVIRP